MFCGDLDEAFYTVFWGGDLVGSCKVLWLENVWNKSTATVTSLYETWCMMMHELSSFLQVLSPLNCFLSVSSPQWMTFSLSSSAWYPWPWVPLWPLFFNNAAWDQSNPRRSVRNNAARLRRACQVILCWHQILHMCMFQPRATRSIAHQPVRGWKIPSSCSFVQNVLDEQMSSWRHTFINGVTGELMQRQCKNIVDPKGLQDHRAEKWGAKGELAKHKDVKVNVHPPCTSMHRKYIENHRNTWVKYIS